MSRKKKLEDEYFSLIKKNKIITKKDQERVNEIVKEWKEIVLKEEKSKNG